MTYVCVMERGTDAAGMGVQQLPDCPDFYHPPNNVGGAIAACTFVVILLIGGLICLLAYWVQLRHRRVMARDKAQAEAGKGRLAKEVRDLRRIVDEHERWYSGADFIERAT